MDFYKVLSVGDKVYVKVLTYNNKVWNGHQWAYMYVTEHYPSENVQHAKNFESMEDAWKWINDHTP